MKHLFLFVVAALLLLVATARAQVGQTQVMPMTIDIELDELGDATIRFQMTMNAQQWQGWKQQYGDNPSLLRRDMGQFVSQYVVDDFDLDQDDMDRTMVMTIKARGVARHRGDGSYELELEPGMGSGNEQDNGTTFIYNYTQEEDAGVLMTVTQTIKLPEDVEDASERTDSAGRPVLAYEVDVDTGSGGGFLTIAGIVLLVLGLAVVPFAFVGGKSSDAS
ncbi:MAG: hypothetical protein AAF561_15595 [Planctomycetota bacterium]